MKSVADWITQLGKEAKELEGQMKALLAVTAPATVGVFGLGTDTAAALVTMVGDNPERLPGCGETIALCGPVLGGQVRPGEPSSSSSRFSTTGSGCIPLSATSAQLTMRPISSSPLAALMPHSQPVRRNGATPRDAAIRLQLSPFDSPFSSRSAPEIGLRCAQSPSKVPALGNEDLGGLLGVGEASSIRTNP